MTYAEALQRVVDRAEGREHLPCLAEAWCNGGGTSVRVAVAVQVDDDVLYAARRHDAPTTNAWVDLAKVARVGGGSAPRRTRGRGRKVFELLSWPGLIDEGGALPAYCHNCGPVTVGRVAMILAAHRGQEEQTTVALPAIS